MGLDSYVYLKHHEYHFKMDESKHEDWEDTFYPPEMGKLGEILKARGSFSKTTSYEVAYWRKANAIHKWFADNCGDGVDECQQMWVSVEKLEKLIHICSKILLDHSLAEKLLPTTDGFFFGGTEYDDWYFRAVESTVRMLDPVLVYLKEHPGDDIYYQASW